MLNNGQAIYDPYWILKNRLGQCGQANRTVVDGLDAVGFKGRLVQLEGHVVAEVWLNGAWRILDAFLSDLGNYARYEEGTIASAEEIYRNPKLVARGRFRKRHAPGFKSYSVMFSVKPYYYYKTATRRQEKNEYYGWNYYETVHD